MLGLEQSTIATKAITEPTERSIPPVMITAVMPIAMMPIAAKLRVTLKKFALVANVSGCWYAVARQINATAMLTQNAWLATMFASALRSWRPVMSSIATLLVVVLIRLPRRAVRRSRSRP